MLQQLMSQARRMEHALTDILDAERLARGEVVLKRRSTEIDTLIRRVVREFPADGWAPGRCGRRDRDDPDRSGAARTARRRPPVLRDDADAAQASASSSASNGPNDGVMLAVEGGAASGVEVGPAASFLAKLHGGWTSAEALPGGRGVARVFLPNVWAPEAGRRRDRLGRCGRRCRPGDPRPAGAGRGEPSRPIARRRPPRPAPRCSGADRSSARRSTPGTGP